MIIHSCEQRSAAWYQLRLGKVTASSAHRLLTPAKFKTYFIELLAETVTRLVNEGFTTEAMQWGIDQEPFAMDWYGNETGHPIMTCGFVEVENMNAGCSPDLIIGDKGMAQIKCPSPKTHAQYMLQGPDSEIIVQQQFEMFCFNAEWNDFVSYDPRWPDHLKGVIKRVERDDILIKKLELKTKEMQVMINEFIFDKNILLKHAQELPSLEPIIDKLHYLNA